MWVCDPQRQVCVAQRPRPSGSPWLCRTVVRTSTVSFKQITARLYCSRSVCTKLFRCVHEMRTFRCNLARRRAISLRKLHGIVYRTAREQKKREQKRKCTCRRRRFSALAGPALLLAFIRDDPAG